MLISFSRKLNYKVVHRNQAPLKYKNIFHPKNNRKVRLYWDALKKLGFLVI
jgi:hypothetical protein